MKNNRFMDRLTGRVIILTRALSAVILLMLLTHSGLAQKNEQPRSFSLSDKLQVQVDRKILPKIDAERLLAEDRGKDPKYPQPLRVAVGAATAFTLRNSGTWQTLPDGRLWRLRIQTPGAKNMSLGITRFDMSEGARLWIYDPRHEYVEGPYTSRDRSNAGSLWTPIIHGDEIVIEIFVPNGIREPIIQIGLVNQGYRDFSKDGPDKSGSCNNDVVCSPDGDPWRDQIRSVARYTFISSSTTYLCSGQLMNNIAVDFTPYFLSANHCVSNSTVASTMVLYWNYESPTCGAHGGGSLANSQVGGASLLATYAPSDFTLVLLNSTPNSAFNVYYSGWDASGVAPASTVGIHHPSGDEKSISFNTDPVTSTSYLSNTVSASANHWRIDDWEDGTTEGGSSGSCLWDVATKRCVGQLHGGYASCTSLTSDWYGKFSTSWSGGGTSSTSLQPWLDPTNTISGMNGDTHITTLNGTRYDFQASGEFVSLRNPDGLEIQIRMTGIGTDFTPGADPYHGLATCVSINSAVAARVGEHRVTIQPNISGVPDPSGLQVRIDSVLTPVGAAGIDLGSGGRIDKSGDAFQVTFPNGTVLMVTPLFWSSQSKWYLNVEVVRNGMDNMDGGDPNSSGSTGGLMAAIANGSWLPALPDGSTVGPMPGALSQRFSDLYGKFGEAWRVTGKTSLFDYKPGTSTETFTDRKWPSMNSSCKVPENPQVKKPIEAAIARQFCRGITDKNTNAHCVFDVMNTAEPDFAKLYLIKQRIQNGLTTTTVNIAKNPVVMGGRVIFEVTVDRRTPGKGALPDGTIQLTLDGKAGELIRLDAKGRANWTTSSLRTGKHQILANYVPGKGSVYIASSSREKVFTVGEK
jgi:hypothetical protein